MFPGSVIYFSANLRRAYTKFISTILLTTSCRLKCKRNNFYVAIRNPVYCGRIFIVKYKDEAAHTVKGLHEGIISQSLFYEVQDVLSDNKKVDKTKVHSPEMLPLRGFIKCSRCSRILYGSASKAVMDIIITITALHPVDADIKLKM